ncbi:nucleotidyltransferase domain-containing protein [Patescibacteria group bacterium]|nr:nucleotidyltransferase domain-containing protein [Patescibacteria group bacterium]
MDSNVNLIVEKLKKIPYYEGIIYAGSRIEGDSSRTSDYDFTVLVSQGKSYYRTFRYKGLMVDICCATEKVIAKNDLVRDRISNAELYIIAHGEIVYDKSGKIKAIQNKAKKVWGLGPKKLSRKDLIEAGYICTVYLHKLSKKDSENAFYLWNEIMQKTTELFFELHNIWQPKFFLVEKAIKVTDRDFFKLYKKIYIADSADRVKLTKKMIKYLVEKFKLPQSGEMYFSKDEN